MKRVHQELEYHVYVEEEDNGSSCLELCASLENDTEGTQYAKNRSNRLWNHNFFVYHDDKMIAEFRNGERIFK